MTDTNITIGTVIHGTLRDEDLLPAFADELARVSNDSHPMLVEPGRMDADENYTDADIIYDLMDALQEYAPSHVYFGNTSDGSDFGWWPQDALGDCETVTLDDENVIDIECQVHIHTNDHGNVTVSELRGKEIWSAV
tara:strand:+ start:108 stop:518 length:411 start_codon:yes stop_codon:yes gene_type:complete